jgi:hypothetical protein
MLPPSEPIVLPGTENGECPFCLENNLHVSAIRVSVLPLDPKFARVSYIAKCHSCGFATSEESRRITFASLVAAYIKADVRDRSYAPRDVAGR